MVTAAAVYGDVLLVTAVFDGWNDAWRYPEYEVFVQRHCYVGNRIYKHNVYTEETLSECRVVVSMSPHSTHDEIASEDL